MLPVVLFIAFLFITVYSEHTSASNIFLDRKVIELHKKAKKEGLTKSDIVVIVDYTLPSTEKRFTVIRYQPPGYGGVVLYEGRVAHGVNSGDKMWATRFSNKENSYMTSVGVMLTGKTYIGKNGLSLELHGLEKGINDNVHKRRVVIHGAPYVTNRYIDTHVYPGYSQGCLALSSEDSSKVISLIKDGVLVIVYAHDKHWLENSKWL